LFIVVEIFFYIVAPNIFCYRNFAVTFSLLPNPDYRYLQKLQIMFASPSETDQNMWEKFPNTLVALPLVMWQKVRLQNGLTFSRAV
jgi:hypothetical protein